MSTKPIPPRAPSESAKSVPALRIAEINAGSICVQLEVLRQVRTDSAERHGCGGSGREDVKKAKFAGIHAVHGGSEEAHHDEAESW